MPHVTRLQSQIAHNIEAGAQRNGRTLAQSLRAFAAVPLEPAHEEGREIRCNLRANTKNMAATLDVDLGLGRGSRGPGRAFDHASYIETLRSLGVALIEYAAGYEAAFVSDQEVQ